MAPRYTLRTLKKGQSNAGFLSWIGVAGNHAYASGGTYHRPTFFGAEASVDEGAFERRGTPECSGLRQTCVLDDALVVVGEYGTVARSTDHGHTWTKTHATQGGCLYATLTWRDRLYITGDAGHVLVSDDGGQNVELMRRGGGRLLGAHATEDAVYFFGDQTLRWDGRKAHPVELPQNAPLCSMATGPEGLVAVGDHGQIVRSPDGERWEKVRSPGRADLETVVRVPDGLVAAGSGGVVLYSETGEAWEALDLGSKEHFWSGCPAGDGALFGAARGAVYLLSVESESWSEMSGEAWSEEFD